MQVFNYITLKGWRIFIGCITVRFYAETPVKGAVPFFAILLILWYLQQCDVIMLRYDAIPYVCSRDQHHIFSAIFIMLASSIQCIAQFQLYRLYFHSTGKKNTHFAVTCIVIHGLSLSAVIVLWKALAYTRVVKFSYRYMFVCMFERVAWLKSFNTAPRTILCRPLAMPDSDIIRSAMKDFQPTFSDQISTSSRNTLCTNRGEWSSNVN